MQCKSSTFVERYLRQFDYRFYLKPHNPMLYVLKNGHPRFTVQQHSPFPTPNPPFVPFEPDLGN
uniref:Uncharacterized protein n=1 Tax=Glossina pallidipes TaxID=7398 RepID=A0A1A9ZQG8_GLOPL